MCRNSSTTGRAGRDRSASERRHRACAEVLESRKLLSVNVLTYRYDSASSGLNSAETQLTPSNVKVGSFGKLFTTSVDGQVYAQPLVDTGLTIAAGPNTTAGAAGVHDVVFVATEHDSLYALNGAAGSGGGVLWQRSFLDPANASNNTLNATAISTVPSADVNSTDISPEIGITGTPVIDGGTNTLYLVVKTKETIGGAAHYVQRLHAINIADGTDRVAPYLIGDTTGGNTNNTSIYVYGTGDGSVTDPYNGTGKSVDQFNALREHQRGALSLVNGVVYAEWASHADNGPYHGWVAAWDVSGLATAGLKLKGVLNTTPNGGLGGIWGGGGKLAFEADGSAFYFETGNGPTGHGNPTLDANGFPADGDYYESLVKVVADTSTTPAGQNLNGWGFKITDYFSPYNQVALDNADRDFGSAAPMILPDSAGIPGHLHLLIASGKEGKIYLVDRDNLGKFDPLNDHVLNAVPNGSGNNTPPVQVGGALSTAAYFNGQVYYTSGYTSTSNAYKINSNGTLTQTSATPETSLGSLPGSVSVSANGTINGITWVMDRNTNQIHAFDATSMSTELWNSGQKSGGADNLGAVVKFASPTVANAQVYVGTTNSLVVFGLTPPTAQAPLAPALTATPLSATSVNLTWTDNTTSPNLATGYLIEQSTDNVNFTQVTTAPAGSTSLSVGGLAANTKYYFRMRGQNGVGASPYSNTASATTTNQNAVIDFSGGFSAAAGKISLNGSAALNGSKLELTNGQSSEAGSAFDTSPVDVTRFSTQFTFQLSAGASTADGFTFTVQGVSPTALGPGGGALGYGDGTTGIGKSVAVKFDLYNNNGEGADSTGLYSNAALPENAGSIDLTPSGVDLHSGDPLLVNAIYDGVTLSVTIKDTVTGKSASQNYSVNIPSLVGAGTAYVGFTGGTSALVATQDILNWTFSPNALQAPNAPSALGAVPATATSVSLNWTTNSTNQSGFHLDRATDAAFTQNLVTQTLPATPSSFTDSATGLAPGSTFYYRLRAFNTAGDSASSNSAALTIPVAPATPTNATVTGVTTGSISLSWTDNAGTTATGYTILRRIGNGTFANYASLPPASAQAKPPSTYAWTDTNLAPATSYEYHIEAVNSSGNNDFAGANAATLTTAPVVTATKPNGLVQLSWPAVTGALQYNVYRGTVPGQEGSTPLAAGITATTWTDSAFPPPGTNYYYTVTAVNSNINHVPAIAAESAPSNELASTLPSNLFTGMDIGSPSIAGSTVYNNGVYTVNGSGADIWGSSDQFQFASTSVSGDATLVARLTSQTNTGPSAKAGVMFRASSSATAMWVMIAQTPGTGIHLQWRDATGASNGVTGPTLAGPVWLKLARAGNTFSAAVSQDGVNYTAVGSVSLALPAVSLAGLAVTSHDIGQLGTGVFDNVGLTSSSLPAGWTSQDVGTPAIAGAAAYNTATGLYALSGAGADIWGTSDQFQFVSTQVSGNTILTARVSAQSNTSAWAKAGVMLRATTSKNSAFVMVAQTPGNGLNFQWRDLNGVLNTVAGPTVAGPVWVRLVRNGNAFTGYTSTDGVNFTAMGSITIAMPTAVLGGLAITSHNSGAAGAASFDNVSVVSTTTSSPLPTGWTSQDIGSPAIAGGVTYNATSGVYAVTGAGADIWGTSDQFQFVSASASGNTTLTARVSAQSNTDPWAKAGIMFRVSTAKNSPFVMLVQTPGHGLNLQWRDANGVLNGIAGPTLGGSVWVRIVRNANTFTGYYSADGTTYTALGSTTFVMPTVVLAGLALTSHNVSALGSASFDNVRVTNP